MNGALGHTGVLLGFAAAVIGVVVLAVGLARGRVPTMRSGQLYAPVVLVGGVIALVAMEHALLTHDFSLSYVAANNSRSTPWLYSITGLWSALAGSILLWGVVLGGYATAMVWRFRQRSGDQLVAWATLVVYVVAAFFFGLMLGPADPFKHVAGAVPVNGPGPNSLLQNNPLVLIHPPMLYLGLVGFTLPFAFAIASLITGRLDEDWQGETRRWTLFAWAFLSVGILLGRLVVLPGTRVGRVLGMGPGGERRPAALAGGHRLSPLGHGAAASGPAAHLEPLAHRGGLQPDHPRHLPDPVGGHPVGALVLRVDHRTAAPGVLRGGAVHRGGPHRLAG